MKEEKNNREEAKVLIDYAKIECNNAKIVLPILDSILTNESPETLNGWDWQIAKFIADRTYYIYVEEDADVDFETGDWGLPVMVGGGTTPIKITIEDKNNLVILRQEVDDILNHTKDKINRFLLLKNKPKWKCKKCDRFLGRELSSLDEIQKLLRNFSIKKYWKCRSCKTLNYFEFDNNGIIFKSQFA
jgi:CRISPR/Cas system-associated exonuclease Cas4 (RecB family)